MELLLKGAPAAQKLQEETARIAASLKEKGVTPKLAMLRIGNRSDSASYERGLRRGCEKCGILAETVELPEESTQAEAEAVLHRLGADPEVHGILLFEPVPKELDAAALRSAIVPEKDVDCAGEAALGALFSGKKDCFAPATPQAVIELLHYYDIPLKGKKAVVLGRSLVVGKPLSLLLLAEDATVTVCHSRTEDVRSLTQRADLIVAAIGKARFVDGSYLGEGQTVVDVGIHVDEEGRLCGDVDFDSAAEKAAALTPVPGGVGSITSAVLLQHVARAAERLTEKRT